MYNLLDLFSTSSSVDGHTYALAAGLSSVAFVSLNDWDRGWLGFGLGLGFVLAAAWSNSSGGSGGTLRDGRGTVAQAEEVSGDDVGWQRAGQTAVDVGWKP